MHDLRSDGHHGIWVKDAAVQHVIPRERLTRRYAWNMYHGNGREYVRAGELPASTVEILGVPKYALHAYVLSLPFVFLFEPIRNAFWLRHFREAATMRGTIDEWRTRRSERVSMNSRSRTDRAFTSP